MLPSCVTHVDMETSACFIRMINMMYTCVKRKFYLCWEKHQKPKGCAPGNIAVCGFCLGWNCTLCVKRNSFTSKSKTISADRHWPQNSLIVVRAISGDLCSKKGPCGAIWGISCCQIRYVIIASCVVLDYESKTNRRHRVVALSKTH